MADLTTTTSGSGAITYKAKTDVKLSLLTSTSGPLSVTATTGAITDNTALESALVQATKGCPSFHFGFFAADFLTAFLAFLAFFGAAFFAAFLATVFFL